MEEFDVAWGEVEKGLRDSFKAGRENKRGQRREKTASDASNQMAMIRQRQNTVSTPPTSTQQNRTAPRRRPAPPPGGPQRQTVSEPPKDWSRPADSKAPDVKVNMKDLDLDQMKEGEGFDGVLSRGRQPQKEKPLDLGQVPTPASPIEKPDERLGNRTPETPIDMTPYKPSIKDVNEEVQSQGGVKDWEEFEQTRRGLQAANRFKVENQTPSLNDAQSLMSGGNQATPVPETGSATSQQPVEQIPADPIDTEIGDLKDDIDLSDGVNDPSNDEQEATQAGWNAVNPPAPEPAPIATPASQEPTISNTVEDGYQEALDEILQDEQDAISGNREVKHSKSPAELGAAHPYYGKEGGPRKIEVEPKETPASVADKPVEVEPEEQTTSVADTPVEAPNPSAGLPKAPTPPEESTAADIAPKEDQAAKIKETLANLRANSEKVEAAKAKAAEKAPAKKAPAKKAPAKKEPAKKEPSKKATVGTVLGGKQPTGNEKKKYLDDDAFGTFAGEKPEPVIKALDWHDLGFLRPTSEDTTFYTDRKGRPAIASALDPGHVSLAHARPSNMSVEQLNRIIEGNHPLSYTNSRLFNTAGKPIMMNLPSAGAMLTGGGGENKDPRNNWVVDGKIQLPNMKKPASDDNFTGGVDLKTLLANNPSLKSSNRQPFGNQSTKNYGIGLPVHYGGRKGPSIGHTLDYGSGRGVYEAQLNTGWGDTRFNVKTQKNENTRGGTPTMMKYPKSPYDSIKPVEMSIGELMQRLKTATSKDAEEDANMNESAYHKDQLKYLLRGLNTQSDKDETVSIYAGNDYPLEARLLGGEYENDAGEPIRNLLTQLIAPRIPSSIEGQNNILE